METLNKKRKAEAACAGERVQEKLRILLFRSKEMICNKDKLGV